MNQRIRRAWSNLIRFGGTFVIVALAWLLGSIYAPQIAPLAVALVIALPVVALVVVGIFLDSRESTERRTK